MSYIKAHFDGTWVVLDEPASLAVGQQVRVVIDPSDAKQSLPKSQTPPMGPAKPAFESTFTPFANMTATLMSGDDWDESAALHIDPLDTVPSDFVRHPGSAAGQIQMADDFDTTRTIPSQATHVQ